MRRVIVLLAVAAAVPPAPASAQSCLVPESQIVSGGPGKDGIPALTIPEVVTAAEASAFLAPSALVLGVTVNGESRAYPHNVLWWHEIVNDVLGGKPITVSYCPLTGSGMVYDPAIAGATLSFGTSGLLFDNNLILYDRSTDSLWSQMRVQAVCGKLAGTVPALLPVVQATWQAWSSLHPDTTAVSFNTGYRRNYNQYPYGTYDQIDNTQLLFPESFIDPRRPMKELALGLTREGLSRAYPYGSLGERAAVNDAIKDLPVLVVFDQAARMALPFDRRVGGRTLSFDPEGAGFPFRLRDRETRTLWDLTGLALEGPLAGSRLTPLATYTAMWFAWAAFHRGTEIYIPGTETSGAPN